uniref:Uncharacterized protein n=1 Tax=Fundulus heteroclitus TaxID=8078 RepID=A0A3Q2Q1P9_FUNHE
FKKTFSKRAKKKKHMQFSKLLFQNQDLRIMHINDHHNKWQFSINAQFAFPFPPHGCLQGGPRDEKPLPIVSVFSDFFPNTSNQMYGARQFTPLGREMVRRDRLILWPGSNRPKSKPGQDKEPCYVFKKINMH